MMACSCASEAEVMLAPMSTRRLASWKSPAVHCQTAVRQRTPVVSGRLRSGSSVASFSARVLAWPIFHGADR
jgi:hypothetical protein